MFLSLVITFSFNVAQSYDFYKKYTVNYSLNSPAIIAFGDFRGHFEPCGCDPRTDLGGMVRIGGYIDLQRQNLFKKKAIEVFSLGNSISFDYFDINNLITNYTINQNKNQNKSKPKITDKQKELSKDLNQFIDKNQQNKNDIPKTIKLSIQDRFILKGLNQIKPTSKLLAFSEYYFLQHNNTLKNDYDLIDPASYLNTQMSIASVYKTKRYVLSDSSLVFGFLFLNEKNQIIEELDKKFVLSFLKKYPKKKAVFLVASLDPQNFLQKNYNFLQNHSDLILFANNSKFDSFIDDKEKQTQSMLYIRYKDLFASMVPLGAQGIKVKNIKTLDLSKLLEKSNQSMLNNKPQPEISSVISTDKFTINHSPQFKLVWLDKNQWISDKFQILDQMYNGASSQNFAKNVEKKLTDLKNTKFVGSHVCAGCHYQAYKTWLDSSHSTAYETLIKKNSHQNSECVVCHVVALDQPGGFISWQYTSHLMGVGCEQCHGPRLDHISKFNDPVFKETHDTNGNNDKQLKLNHKKLANDCQSCHHPPHSVSFDQKKRWQQIRHGM